MKLKLTNKMSKNPLFIRYFYCYCTFFYF